jgi:hypothetical protein
MIMILCPRCDVDGNIELTGVTGWNPDSVEFAVLETDKECAVRAAVRDGSEAGDIISWHVFKRELIRCLKRNAGSVAFIFG